MHSAYGSGNLAKILLALTGMRKAHALGRTALPTLREALRVTLLTSLTQSCLGRETLLQRCLTALWASTSRETRPTECLTGNLTDWWQIAKLYCLVVGCVMPLAKAPSEIFGALDFVITHPTI
ncbi:hypothetical protein BZZ01_01905 [Nostocales cyanobacterium HT-58-2]|nr:hypothetical protein BZZ01_01905 [Nostocales cyanobacterium HT-58-2]